MAGHRNMPSATLRGFAVAAFAVSESMDLSRCFASAAFVYRCCTPWRIDIVIMPEICGLTLLLGGGQDRSPHVGLTAL
jgi:hypothetical protein